MADVLALGELLIDFTPFGKSNQENLLFEQNSGGAPANVASMIAKLGGHAVLAAKVGEDQFGLVLKEILLENGVDISLVTTTAQANTTLAFVHLDETGDRTFSFYRKPGADIFLDINDVPVTAIQDAKVVHFGTVSMTQDPSYTTTLSVVKKANEFNKIISFDPNVRLKLWEDVTLLKERIHRVLHFVDLLKVSEEELFFITEEEHEEKACDFLHKKYQIPCIVITRGGDGSSIFLDQKMSHVASISVNAIDTTGAGDAFWGAFLYQVSQHAYGNQLPTSEKLISYLTVANTAGALTTTRRGGIPALPSFDEINRITKI